MRLLTRVPVFAMLSVLVVLPPTLWGTEPPNKGPLAGPPSQAGPHIEKIKALGNNEWLHLGSPAADPKWGKARGRSWSSNQPAAANLRGAFVFGEGVHAYVKPDGHYMNDLWFYDINAHRWICLYSGIEVKAIAQTIKDRKFTLDNRGLLVDREGQPLPPLLIHAYGFLGYDPDQKKFAVIAGQFANYFTTDGERGVFREANQLYQEMRKGKKFPSLSPFFYDVVSGNFECHALNAVPRGGQPWGGSQLVYVESNKQFFWLGTSGAWTLDRDRSTWVDLKPKGTLPTGIDHCAAYDPKRDCIYYYTSSGKKAEDNFFIYDIKKNTWSRPETQGTGPFHASSYESIFNYDSANDALVIIRLYDKEKPGYRRGVYAYHPETKTWFDPLPLPTDVVKSIRNGNYGFYDAELNAYFCHFVSDSSDNGTMWVYRYKERVGNP